MNQLNFPLLSKCVDYLLVIFSNSDIFGAMLLKLHFGGFQSIFYVLCRTQSFHSQVKYTVLNVSVINLFKWVEMETLSFSFGMGKGGEAHAELGPTENLFSITG